MACIKNLMVPPFETQTKALEQFHEIASNPDLGLLSRRVCLLFGAVQPLLLSITIAIDALLEGIGGTLKEAFWHFKPIKAGSQLATGLGNSCKSLIQVFVIFATIIWGNVPFELPKKQDENILMKMNNQVEIIEKTVKEHTQEFDDIKNKVKVQNEDQAQLINELTEKLNRNYYIMLKLTSYKQDLNKIEEIINEGDKEVDNPDEDDKNNKPDTPTLKKGISLSKLARKDSRHIVTKNEKH